MKEKSFAERLVLMRKENNYTQEELAELLDIPEEQMKYITDVSVGEG